MIVAEETASGRRVIGRLTDRDIVTAAITKAVDPARLHVEDVTTTDVVLAIGSEQRRERIVRR